MNAHWTRTSALNSPLSGDSQELWELREAGRIVESFPIDVKYGKPFDVLGLKSHTTETLLSLVNDVREAIDRLYGVNAPKQKILGCPCCSTDVDGAEIACTIHGIEYKRCAHCGHIFVGIQPTVESLNRGFVENDSYANHYVDSETLEKRLAEIIAPKFDWVRQTFQSCHGENPASIIDIGAGGGHFVGYCGRLGLEAVGYELSKTATDFAHETFGIQLCNENYLTENFTPGKFDLVTFWGLLEYTPNPSAFLAAARAQMTAGRGMLVVEVPRADALSTAIQSQSPDTVWRHLSPASHMNVFSDAALSHLLQRNGFRPIAAWYFGMDVYEWLSQVSMTLTDDRILNEMAYLTGPLQQWMDSARLCDDIIVAAIPV